MNIANKLIREHRLTVTEYAELICSYKDKSLAKYLADEAVRIRKEIYGDTVFVRGLIEFTNICKNDCLYCGIRKSNPNVERYRLTKEEILSCCDSGYQLGYRTFVLQGGEDGYYTDERLADIVRTIKARYPDCALTLSVGERSFESYRLLREAGVDRYLLRHETADAEHYRRLHPPELSLENRMQCLRDLRTLGYQVGAGFMVGSPYQTVECLAEDLMFLQDFQPEMAGIGPFIPHHDTVFAKEPAGSVELTLFLLSVIRIMLPHVLLPATTALGTLSPTGRERGMLAGANVVMSNLSPVENRKQYELYDNKICTGEEAAECRGCLANRMKSVGFTLVTDRGDYRS
ncbi:MAG: [FeFe] hydrogenase H-cluster radical SAM maturase HydE [Lachnospiraceae bacterium]|nr:[FeFe] hydrogenase H-cluster radical SAM maturase HydE [Lachnospiraceae bacterium]